MQLDVKKKAEGCRLKAVGRTEKNAFFAADLQPSAFNLQSSIPTFSLQPSAFSLQPSAAYSDLQPTAYSL
jgi:hypothetical protein